MNLKCLPDGSKVLALMNDCTMPFPNPPSNLAPNPAAERYLIAYWRREEQITKKTNDKTSNDAKEKQETLAEKPLIFHEKSSKNSAMFRCKAHASS